jgi:hypothetical protein
MSKRKGLGQLHILDRPTIHESSSVFTFRTSRQSRADFHKLSFSANKGTTSGTNNLGRNHNGINGGIDGAVSSNSIEMTLRGIRPKERQLSELENR